MVRVAVVWTCRQLGRRCQIVDLKSCRVMRPKKAVATAAERSGLTMGPCYIGEDARPRRPVPNNTVDELIAKPWLEFSPPRDLPNHFSHLVCVCVCVDKPVPQKQTELNQ